ncbi:MAG: DEAD/DEAH box helicase [Christensenellales bacterium]|jgi:ATP-dependent Lhr-like helicase
MQPMGLSLFSENTRNWFLTAVGQPTPVQDAGWRAIAGGGDVIVSAPTGTGKTLTAFLYWLDALAARPRPIPDACEIIYISPLKALGNDIRENLQKPLQGLGLKGIVRTGVRTGDTTPSERAAMIKRPPHILITTPESLYLLLTSKRGRDSIKTAKCVVVDEIHAVIDSKRGAHLMLSLERLDALCERRLQRIALSATIRPLARAAMYISGGRGAQAVAPPIDKAIEMRVALAEKDFRALPEKSVWPAIADRAYRLSREVRTTLAFVDGRAQAEKLAHGVNAIAGGRYARTHHGCVSKEQRLEAERSLRAGELKLMCCTSSMELGIDVGDIDLVLQVGAPRSIAGALQRAGRAGHGPGRVSELIIFPKTEADTLLAALAAKGALEGRIEDAHIPQKCLDVAAQHLIAMAAAGGYTVDEAHRIITGAWPCRDVTHEEVESLLRMLAGDFEHERELPVRPRILYDRINENVRGDNYTRMLAFSCVGTIPDRGWYAVTLPDGTKLGELDEEYVFEARLGDKFLLGAFAWRIREITRDRVIVSSATPEGAQTPFWRGDALGRPLGTGRYYGKILRELNDAAQAGTLKSALGAFPLAPEAAEAAAHHIKRQIEATGCLPDDRTIIAEHFADSAGEHQLMIHSIFGNRVNHALSMLLRRRAAEITGLDVRGYDDDDGMLLYLLGGSELPEGLIEGIDSEGARERIEALLPAEPMFSMAYRYAAARAGMMGMRGHARQPLWVQRLRGAESLAGAIMNEAHPLVHEALRECREDLLDVAGAVAVLRGVRAGEIRVIELHTEYPSPMALPLRRQVEAELMYESPIPSRAMKFSEEKFAAMAPAAAAVEKRYARARVIDEAETLHAILMAEGDLLPGETDAPSEWFEALARAGRAMYIEPGLWIAAEQADLYESPDRTRMVRRCIRFRGAQDARSIAQRYAIPEAEAQGMLDALAAEGVAVAFEGMWVHADVYQSAQRLTLTMRRSEVSTVPPARFARLMAARAQTSGSQKTRLAAGMAALIGIEAPAAQWEEILLPARVPGYRPEMLDLLLAEGGIAYAMNHADGKAYLQFRAIEQFDYDSFVPIMQSVSPEEARILEILEKGGAQFDYVISKRLGGMPVGERLQRLAALGYVKQDTFAPVRRAIDPRPRARNLSSAGRWARAHALRDLPVDECIECAFANAPILARETCRHIPWQAALERLRVMEMTGEVRRGYFVEGLSGAQFVKSEEFQAVTAALCADGGYACLNAVDPMQAWGRYVKHIPGREFLLVPGTAVVMRGGEVACVFERQGAVLRVFGDEGEAIRCFAKAFLSGGIFTGRSRITVSQYDPAAAEWLADAGFVREALDYVLYAK